MSIEKNREEAVRRGYILRDDVKELARLLAIHDYRHALDEARKRKADIERLVMTLEVCNTPKGEG